MTFILLMNLQVGQKLVKTAHLCSMWDQLAQLKGWGLLMGRCSPLKLVVDAAVSQALHCGCDGNHNMQAFLWSLAPSQPGGCVSQADIAKNGPSFLTASGVLEPLLHHSHLLTQIQRKETQMTQLSGGISVSRCKRSCGMRYVLVQPTL